jgi:uncharacterized protein
MTSAVEVPPDDIDHSSSRPGGALIVSRCPDGHSTAYPPLDRCPVCWAPTERIVLSGSGRLYSFSTVAVGPAAPYTVGYVDTPEGARIFARLTTPEADLRPDQPVRLRLADGRATWEASDA